MEDFESNIIVKYRHPLVKECECSYSRLVERMLDEKFTKDWMIEDELNVSHQFGESIFTIHFVTTYASVNKEPLEPTSCVNVRGKPYNWTIKEL